MPRDDNEQEQEPAFNQHAKINSRDTRSDTRKAARPSSREPSITLNARNPLTFSEPRTGNQSNDVEPRYHGPTSTLFEDTIGDRRAHQSKPAAPRLPTAWIQKGLMAEAAYQRMRTISRSNGNMILTKI